MEQVTKSDLQQLEERLTKLIEEKVNKKLCEFVIGNEEQPEDKQDLPPFPFWVEITKGEGWYINEVGNKFEVKGWSNPEGNVPNHYALKDEMQRVISTKYCKILHDYKPEEKKPILEINRSIVINTKTSDSSEITKITIDNSVGIQYTFGINSCGEVFKLIDDTYIKLNQ